MSAQKAQEAMDTIIATARRYPEQSRIRWKFNNDGPWEVSTGREFLELWEQPVAGTIYIDSVVVLPEEPLP